ncbi:lipoprotein [Spiroplasma diminutum]|uniref:Lipoprotein n=1 Tax=Spiroplasma diminutum CUAS-1 TaxID=1276221 RepID=S5MJI4_9MOLU|nr:lipoprotein [Spiroplasma diminutum]AGR42135.1 hypothetical protein SDIMI_v3c04310 [Spiroplasma diminutum CUAS-1]
MKKLLTILTGFTITLAPVSQIVSCKITENNTYSKSSDIEKFWLYKSQNTVVFSESSDDETDKNYINNEIKKLISFNFKNQEEVNDELDINLDNEVNGEKLDDKIEFEFYSTANEKTIIGDTSKLKEYLVKEFGIDDILTTKSLYFKYKLKVETESKFNSTFLEIKFTNKPKMKENVFKDKALLTESKINTYFFNDLQAIIKEKGGTFNKSLLDNKNKAEIVFFIKGILDSIKDINDKKVEISNSIEWVKNTNKHTANARPMEWSSLTPEETLYELILNSNEITEPQKSFIDFTDKIYKEKKFANSDFATWLGLTGKTFVVG